MAGASLAVQMNAAQIVDANSVRAWQTDKANVLTKMGSISHA
jgi:hypothetical protein